MKTRQPISKLVQERTQPIMLTLRSLTLRLGLLSPLVLVYGCPAAVRPLQSGINTSLDAASYGDPSDAYSSSDAATAQDGPRVEDADPDGCLSTQASAPLWNLPMQRRTFDLPLVLDEGACRLYATDFLRGRLVEIDLRNGSFGQTLRSITVGTNAIGVVRSVDGSRFYVATDAEDRLIVVDATTFTMQSPLLLRQPRFTDTVGPPAELVRLGDHTAVTTFGTEDGSRGSGSIDLETGDVTSWTDDLHTPWPMHGNLPMAVLASRDHATIGLISESGYLYFANAMVGPTSEVWLDEPRQPLAGPAFGLGCMSLDGRWILLSNSEVLAQDGHRIGLMGTGPLACAFSADGSAWMLDVVPFAPMRTVVLVHSWIGQSLYAVDRSHVVPATGNALSPLLLARGEQAAIYFTHPLDPINDVVTIHVTPTY